MIWGWRWTYTPVDVDAVGRTCFLKPTVYSLAKKRFPKNQLKSSSQSQPSLSVGKTLSLRCPRHPLTTTVSRVIPLEMPIKMSQQAATVKSDSPWRRKIFKLLKVSKMFHSHITLEQPRSARSRNTTTATIIWNRLFRTVTKMFSPVVKFLNRTSIMA